MPADRVSEVGDVLLSASVNGGDAMEITRQYQAIDMMLSVRVGDEVTLRILRNGEEITVSMIITQECLVAY